MIARRGFSVLSALFLAHGAHASLPANKTISLDRQFVVYCDDAPARSAVASFAETTKRALLAMLGQPDRWKYPIVVDVDCSVARGHSQPPSRVQLCEVEGGFKIQVNVAIGADPAAARFGEQIVHAVLLELAYRDAPKIKGGLEYAEPPAWLVAGTVKQLQSREFGADADLFRNFMASSRGSSVKDVIEQKFRSLDSTSQAVFDAYSMGLVQLLVEAPGGGDCLTAFIRHHPRPDQALAQLLKDFPVFKGEEASLEKSWMLSLARFAAADRYKGLSAEETEKEIAGLLTFKVPVGKANTMQQFAITDFNAVLKLPAGRSTFGEINSALLALSARAHPLYRPIVQDYQQIAFELSRGKTKHIQNRLSSAADYRKVVLGRLDQIGDFLNWYEATQLTSRSDSFDGYIRTANALADETKRDDPISRYLDAVELECE